MRNGASLRVLGAGGHAKVAAEAWMCGGGIVSAFHDDDLARVSHRLLGILIAGPIRAAAASGDPLHIAIGSNDARRRIADGLAGASFPRVRHPAATFSPSSELGEGCLVAAGAILQPECTVGRHSIINTSAIIEHDVVVGDFVHVAPGVRLGGSVFIEDEALVGIGATVLPGVRIGHGAIIGAGAVVVRDVPPRSVFVGNPAAPIRG